MANPIVAKANPVVTNASFLPTRANPIPALGLAMARTVKAKVAKRFTKAASRQAKAWMADYSGASDLGAWHGIPNNHANSVTANEKSVGKGKRKV